MVEGRYWKVLLALVAGFSIAYAPDPCPVSANLNCNYCNSTTDGWIIDCANKDLQHFPNITTDQIINKLYLQNNRIESIPLYKLQYINVRELYLQFNDLRSTGFLSNPSVFTLEILDLSENQNLGQDVAMAHFTHLSNLRNLKMPNTGLQDLNFLRDPNSVDHLKTLEIIDVSRSQLGGDGDIHPDTFNGKQGLRKIIATDSHINNIDFLKSSSLGSLDSLWLQRNRVSSLARSHVRYLTNLSVFMLNNNLLTTLRQEVINELSAITTFEWDSNPAQCDCRISWILIWIYDNPTLTMTYDASLDTCNEFNNPSVCTTETTVTMTTATSGSSTSSTKSPAPPHTTTPLPTNPSPTNPAPTITAPTNPTPTNPAPTNLPPTNPPPTNPPPTNPPPTKAPAPTTNLPPQNGLSSSVIIAIAVSASVVVLVIIIVITVVVCKKLRRAPKYENASHINNSEENGFGEGGGRMSQGKENGIYHYYSAMPDERPPSLGDMPPAHVENRPLPAQPRPAEGVGQYMNPREDKYGYLQPADAVHEYDGGYIEIKPDSYMADGQYETLKIKDSDPVYDLADDAAYQQLETETNASNRTYDAVYQPPEREIQTHL